MKKASCVLIIVLLLLLEISAKAEWVSIVELRQQVDEMGRWIQNYTDTYGRTSRPARFARKRTASP